MKNGNTTRPLEIHPQTGQKPAVFLQVVHHMQTSVFGPPAGGYIL